MTENNQQKILVTGGSGQLATSLRKRAPDEVVIIGRPEFDFDRPESILEALARYRPSAIVNAAAWTAVDLAESHEIEAKAANQTGPEIIARYCREARVPFIHVSTDYVFSGNKGAPYEESDPIAPCTVYGRTKADGEAAVMAANPESVILRTSWVYAPHGKNFVRTMLNAGAKNPRLKVVADQRGNPTNADDLAEAVLTIVHRLLFKEEADALGGIYHAAGSGETTWHGLAVAALEDAVPHGQPFPEEVTPIATEDWPTPAKRPMDSRLSCQKMKEVFGVGLPDWRVSLKRAVDEVFTGKAV